MKKIYYFLNGQVLLVTVASVVFALWSSPAILAANPTYTTTTSVPGYPGGTSTTVPSSNIINQNLGSTTVGSTLTANSCGFTPSSNVSLILNGSVLGTQGASSNGCVVVIIKVISANTTSAVVQINNHDYSVALTNNNLSAKGTGSNGASLTVNNVFGITVSVPGATPQTGEPFLGLGLLATTLLIIGLLLALAPYKLYRSHTKQ